MRRPCCLWAHDCGWRLRHHRGVEPSRTRPHRPAGLLRGAHPDARRAEGLHLSSTPHPPRGDSDHDIVIVGGGLAGLTLALQLRRRHPDIDVLVLERRAHPVPHACHKVGESSVEIGAHYFQHVLGLETHLAECQLRKFGFRFFFSDGRRDIDAVTELGASRPLAVTSWQLDRGIFENFLGAEARRRGIAFVDGAAVRRIELAADDTAPHRVDWQRVGDADGTTHTVQARWIVDASGRAGLLKRQLGLARPSPHGAHAVWFRVAGRIEIDGWSDDPAWRARCVTPTRWLSTNHLVGAGYWVWLIPLASGSHSVGIVADPRFHPLESMNTYERALDWLRVHQPRLHDDLAARGEPQDFAFLRRFSHDCEQVFSARRWALAGESGRFLDPFYSPGSDFIAIGNTYICELIGRDRAGLPLAAHAQVYEQIFRSFFDSTLALYVDQYGLFGDPEVLPVKVVWDYTYYWGVLAPLFFSGHLVDMRTLSLLRAELAHCLSLNAAVQPLLRAWSDHSLRRNPPRLLDQAAVPWFAELNRALLDRDDGEAFGQRMRAAALLLRTLATELLDRACADHEAVAAGPAAAALVQAIEAGGGPVRGGEALLFPAVDEGLTATTQGLPAAA